MVTDNSKKFSVGEKVPERIRQTNRPNGGMSREGCSKNLRANEKILRHVRLRSFAIKNTLRSNIRLKLQRTFHFFSLARHCLPTSGGLR